MKITQAFTFEAAHRLPHVPETHKCFRLHGHSYRVEFTYIGKPDPITGFVIDFFDVEKEVSPFINMLDHHFLNNIDGLQNPTAENIAMWFHERTKADIVRVYETPMCWAECL